ncbi:MAG: hypothetical protein NTX03_00085 [Bacteroidetes bacterium]|nr:hypothetical protein [Bacteroidota bacterium]
MIKKIFALFAFALIVDSVNGQTFYKNNLIEMMAFFNTIDSSICLRIKNTSDSVLVLNDKETNYRRINKNHVTDLSLVSTGVSLLQPGSGDLMHFKRLSPKSTYTITINKRDTSLINISTFKLLIEIQYLTIPSNLYIRDNILNRDLLEIIAKENLNIHYYDGKLKIDEKYNNCLKVLRSVSN